VIEISYPSHCFIATQARSQEPETVHPPRPNSNLQSNHLKIPYHTLSPTPLGRHINYRDQPHSLAQNLRRTHPKNRRSTTTQLPTTDGSLEGEEREGEKKTLPREHVEVLRQHLEERSGPHPAATAVAASSSSCNSTNYLSPCVPPQLKTW
jgi:hypothetical protein